jgi:hypothetical protein
MNLLPVLHAGKLIVIASSHEPREQISSLTVELALRGAVTVLDGGNRFAAYQIIRMLRKRTHKVEEAANRIFVRRAFTCYQVLALLENSPSLQQPYIVLDMFTTFYDENIQLTEVDRLLDHCLFELDRLRLTGPVVITIRPHLDRSFLFERLLAKADHVFELKIPHPVISQMALF